MYTMAWNEYRIFASSRPTPDVAPVMRYTFPHRSSSCASVKVGAGGQICVKVLILQGENRSQRSGSREDRDVRKRVQVLRDMMD